MSGDALSQQLRFLKSGPCPAGPIRVNERVQVRPPFEDTINGIVHDRTDDLITVLTVDMELIDAVPNRVYRR